MVRPSFPFPSEARTRTSLEAEFTRAVTTPGLSALVGRKWEALFPRFARYYERLTRLPRRRVDRKTDADEEASVAQDETKWDPGNIRAPKPGIRSFRPGYVW